MTNITTTAPRQTALESMASRLNVDPQEMQGLVMNTLMSAKGGRGQVTNEEFVTFLAIANEYRLNPLTKEIYAFNNRGAIQPIVSIDGWLKIINHHPEFDGMEFDDRLDANGSLMAITCRIYRKDRQRPTEVTEYMEECRQGSPTWSKWPARMLRHKAAIQAARYAFGLSGIIDEDEAERYKSTQMEREVNPAPRQSTSSLKAAIDGKPEQQEPEWTQEQTDQFSELMDKFPLAESLAQLKGLAGELKAMGDIPADYREAAMTAYTSRKSELEAITE